MTILNQRENVHKAILDANQNQIDTNSRLINKLLNARTLCRLCNDKYMRSK